LLHKDTRSRLVASLATRLGLSVMICIRHGTGRALRAISFIRSSPFSSHQPNAPLDIDESFRDILQDIGNSAVDQKLNAPPRIHELTAYPTDSEPDKLTHLDDEPHTSIDRKSPAALFGSQRIGAVVIPQELQQTISGLISGENAAMLNGFLRSLTRHMQTLTNTFYAVTRNGSSMSMVTRINGTLQ
jgi:hypothetical protein